MTRFEYLASLIAKHARQDGRQTTALRGLSLSRYSELSTPRKPLDRAVLCFVAQGAKSVLSAQQEWTYHREHFLIVCLDVPLVAQIVGATRAKPFLGLDLDLNLADVGEVCEAVSCPATKIYSQPESIFLGTMDHRLLETLIRLVELLDKPQEAEFLYRLVRKEIVYHVISGTEGALCKILTSGSHSMRVQQAIQWMKTDLGRSIPSKEIAKEMRVSLTGMHNAFKAATGMSPVQFHQNLRLHEARRLLLYEEASAEEASLRVGYGSASQFSREYRRLFGAPPRKDVKRIRLAEPQRS